MALMRLTVLTLLLITGEFKSIKADKCKHEQVHISLGTNETEMVVTWATMSPVSSVLNVRYGKAKDRLDREVKSETKYFDLAKLYTHRALMVNLEPNEYYYYQVGSQSTCWSKVFQFHTLKTGTDWLPKLMIYGDLGYQSEESLPFIEEEAKQYDAIFHIGDLAYDLHFKGGELGNMFMRSIEQVAAQTPYMTCPGNHERTDNFSHYDARFSMLGDRNEPHPKAPLSTRLNNHYYSVNIGPLHLVAISTEFYHYPVWGWQQIEWQYRWLVKDLTQANRNRQQQPWIIVMGHRPMYCLKLGDKKSCDNSRFERPKLRNGLYMYDDKNRPKEYGLEELFYQQGVDLQFYAHEHFYARFLPTYKFVIHPGVDHIDPYANSMAPVHITTGSAGCREFHPVFNPKLNTSWVVANHLDYGYTRLIMQSRLEMILEQTSIDQNNIVLDRIKISKTTDYPAWIKK